MGDMASKGRRVCRTHIDSACTQCRTKTEFLMTGACERPSAACELKSGFGAALGRQEANWKGRRRQILAMVGRGGQMVWMTAATAVRMCV